MGGGKFIFIVILNLLIVLSEIMFGLVSNSTALIADAVHNLSDIMAILITYVALHYSRKSPTRQNTFGYIRGEMMATFNNSLFLIVIMGYVLYESAHSLLYDIDQPVDGGLMIMVATVALIANGWSAYLLHKIGVEHHHEEGGENSNIKSAYLHFLADSLLSLSVIIGGIVIYTMGINYIDKALSLIFSLYIIFSTFPLLRDSFYSLMDIKHSIDIDSVESFILKFDEVDSLHDVHLIEPSPRHSFFYAHIVLNRNLSLQDIEYLNYSIEQGLKKFGINHSVIQPETKDQREESIVKKSYLKKGE
jgi:cobalt-zinc-cadmium efflux system protein